MRPCLIFLGPLGILPRLCARSYPADEKNKNGKLRLLYECAPMSFIAEQVGTALGKGGRGDGVD